jgi:hypothetical protein
MHSPLEALTKGTPHRCDKGAGPDHRVRPHRHAGGTPARERLVEVVGAERFRTQVKRRKAYRAGKLARGSEALYSSLPGVYWRRDRAEVHWPYPRPSAGFRRKAVGPRTKGQGNR